MAFILCIINLTMVFASKTFALENKISDLIGKECKPTLSKALMTNEPTDSIHADVSVVIIHSIVDKNQKIATIPCEYTLNGFKSFQYNCEEKCQWKPLYKRDPEKHSVIPSAEKIISLCRNKKIRYIESTLPNPPPS